MVKPEETSDPWSMIKDGPPGDEDAGENVPRPLRPDSPAIFAANQTTLARDLILKEQQTEALINNLPGIGTSEKEQEERIRVLEQELRQMHALRKEKRKEMRGVVKKLEDVIMGVASSHDQS
jgi:mediator of RNA polymerase II transcription subunit 21